jgi:TonB family protein
VLKLGTIQERVQVTAAGTPIPRPVRTRVGGNVQPARLLKMARAIYPESAKAAGTEGTVLVHAVVLRDGSMGNPVAFPSADAELAKAAVEAVKQWKYEPARLNGEPVEVVTAVEVEFRLVPR